MAAELGTAFVTIMPSMNRFGRDLDRQMGSDAESSGKTAGKRFGSAMKVGALAIIGGAGLAAGFLKGAVDEASDLSESASKVGVVFGKSSGQIVKASKTSATAMGLTKAAYLGATGSLGNLLVSLDLAPKKAADMSQEMVKLAGDLASFNNVSPEEALAALQSGLTGETEPLKRFGVNMNDATLKAQALKDGLISSTKDALTPQTKALAAQALIMEQTKTAQGDFARTSGGLANQQRILSAQFGNLKATIGTALLPVVTRFVTMLNKSAPMFGRVADRLAPLGATFRELGATIRSALQPILERVFEFLAANTGVIKLLGVAAVALVSPIAAIALGLAALHLRSKTFRTVAASVSGFITGTLVPAFVQLGQYLYANLVPVFKQVADIIVTNVVPIVARLAQFLYGTLYPAVMGIVTSVAKNLRPVFEQLVKTYQTQVLPALQKLLVKFREWQPTLEKIITTVVKFTGSVLKIASAILGKVLPPLVKFAGFLIGNLFRSVSVIITVVLKVISKLIDFRSALINGGKTVLDFGKKVGTAVANVVKFFTGIPGKITKAVGDLSGLLLEAGKDAARGLWAGLDAMSSWLKGKVWDWVKSVLPGPVEKALGIKSPSRVLAELGMWAARGLALGLEKAGKEVTDKASKLAAKLRGAIQKGLDQRWGVFDTLKNEFASIRGNISGAFGSDFFGEETVGAALTKGWEQFTGGQAVEAAFAKLRKMGAKNEFLNGLLGSGNTALILDFAGGAKSDLLNAQKMFTATNATADRIGYSAAQVFEVNGKQLGKSLLSLEKEILALNRLLGGKGKGGKGSKGPKGKTIHAEPITGPKVVKPRATATLASAAAASRPTEPRPIVIQGVSDPSRAAREVVRQEAWAGRI